MRKKLSKYLIGIVSVIVIVAIGSFPAFALGASPMALVAAATTAATPFATQVKLLAISGSVYALLQVVKQAFPLAGLGAILANVALSVLGVVVVIKPEDLFSLNTLTLVGIAAITAAGAHGTIKSFAGGPATAGDSSVRSGVAMLCIVLLLSTSLLTGCNYSQAEVVKGVQRVETGLKFAKGLLPEAQLIVNALQNVDPEAASTLAPFVAIAGPNLDNAIQASDVYLQNPGNDAFQAILNAVDAFTSQVDQKSLALAGIKNPNSQTKVVAWIALFATTLHVSLGVLENYATSKQRKAVPVVTARVSFDQIRPFLNRSYAHDELVQMGYSNPDQILAYAGL
jgi:hypothetical protein